MCRCLLCHSDVGDYGNTLYLLYGIHPLTRKERLIMHGFWVSTEVFIDDVEGYLWGEGKKLWSKMSDKEQWDCFDWMCDNVSTEDETGDIDNFIVLWYKENYESGDDDDELSDEGRCRRESRRIRFRRKR